MEKDASLDIALDYLYLVGGYEMLEKEWGGRREDRNFSSMTSKQYENALKVLLLFIYFILFNFIVVLTNDNLLFRCKLPLCA